MPRRNLTSLAAAVVAAIGSFSATAQQPPAARPTAVPTTLPSEKNAQPIEALEAEAIRAFESSEYATALPLLKELSVRLRNSPERVAPLLEKVRVCEANLAQQLQTAEKGPREPHVKPAADQAYEVTLQKLGNFEYDAEVGGGIPEDVKSLSGSKVKLIGYMIPMEESDKVSKFVLVPDLFACCFGQPPSIQHTAVVVCPPGKAVSYFADEITVLGELTVAEVRDEGYVTHIFEVKASSIRPAAK